VDKKCLIASCEIEMMETTHTTAVTIKNKFQGDTAPCDAAVRLFPCSIFVKSHIHGHTVHSHLYLTCSELIYEIKAVAIYCQFVPGYWPQTFLKLILNGFEVKVLYTKICFTKIEIPNGLND
jgi:hypothetical protein